MAGQVWTATDVVAYTEHDGPGRPPRVPGKAVGVILACVLGATLFGMMAADTMCPEHRAWAMAIASAALLTVPVAAVASWRGWASGPRLTAVAGVLGVATGVLDTIHAPMRGVVVASIFALIAIAACVLSVITHRALRWDPDARPVEPMDDLVPASRPMEDRVPAS